MTSQSSTRKPGFVVLRAHFLATTDEQMAVRLAEMIARSSDPEAGKFLVRQAERSGKHAEAAIRALAGSASAADADLVRALEANPNRQNLARAVPAGLSGSLAQRLLRVVPRVTEPAALRYLVERVARLLPGAAAQLRKMEQSLDDPLLRRAFSVGRAAAGDEVTLHALAGELEKLQATDTLLLMLSCRALAKTGHGCEKIRRMLVSLDPAQIAAALWVVGGLGLEEHAQAVAACYVFETAQGIEDELRVALPVAMQHLQRDQLAPIVGATLRLLRGHDREVNVCGRTRTQTAVLDRATDLVAGSGRADQSLLDALVGGTLVAAARLAPLLLADRVSDEVLEARARLGELQQRLAVLMWPVDPLKGAECKAAASGGMITGEQLQGLEGIRDERSAVQLIAALEQEARTGARIVVEQQAFEPAKLRQARTLARSARNALRRLQVLQCLLGQETAEEEAVAALEASRSRETAARKQAGKALGDEELLSLQDELDGRVVVRGIRATVMGEFWKRVDRGLQEQGLHRAVQKMLTEQILQADLLALLAALPHWTGAACLLVELLEAPSALVRAAAREALAGHAEAADALQAVLQGDRDAMTQAHALEILRCLWDGCALDHAHQALVSAEPLLQAAAVRYIARCEGIDGLSERLPDLLAADELVALACIQSVRELRLPNREELALLAGQVGTRHASVGRVARKLLCRHHRSATRTALGTALASDDAYSRVAASRVLDQARRDAPESPLAAGSQMVPVGGDSVLGQCLLTAGEGPWQWGLPGLQTANLVWYEGWACLLETDEEVARSWEDWIMSGWEPFQLLPRLQKQAAEGGAVSDAATALAMDVLLSTSMCAIELFVYYQEVDVASTSEEAEDMIIQIMVDAFRRCTPALVSQLVVPNPSRAAAIPGVMLTGGSSPARACLFAMAYFELLQDGLSRNYPLPPASPTPWSPGAFRKHMAHEWEHLMRFADPYYGFAVVPRVSLEDLGRYCADPKADAGYRTAIAAYLACEATTRPVLPVRREEARKALTRAYSRRFRSAAISIASARRTHDQSDRREPPKEAQKIAFEELKHRFWQALDEFDVYWMSPRPMLPMGTLGMAVEPLGPRPDHPVSTFPERHLSLANLLEKTVATLLREAFEHDGVSVAVQSLDQIARDQERDVAVLGPASPGSFEDEVIARVDSGQSTAGVADEALAPSSPDQLDVRTYPVEIKGTLVECYDIRGVADLLRRSVDTLRRCDRDGSITFVRHRNRRYLPVEELDAARIAVRTTAEWATMLGVSKRTVEYWMRDAPPGIDPSELERLLKERAARKGKHRR